MIQTAPSRQSCSRARAVTLLELLVVLGLLVAIFALATPLVFRSMPGRALRNAQDMFIAALDSVRAHAQREGVMVELSVDGSGRLLRARELPIDGGEAIPIPSLAFEIEAPMRLVVGENGGTIAVFLPDGSAPMTRPCILRNTDADGDAEATVTISSLLGRPTVARRAVSTADEYDDPLSEQLQEDGGRDGPTPGSAAPADATDAPFGQSSGTAVPPGSGALP